MAYVVIATEEFTEWLDSLTQSEVDALTVVVRLLQDKGHTLGRPYVDTLKGSAYANMKELRVAHKRGSALRVAFAFDPNRAAILLLGGDKHAKRGFYGKLLRKADELFTKHIRMLRE